MLSLWQKFNSYAAVQKLRRRAKPLLAWYDRLIPDPSLSDVKARWNEWARSSPYYYAYPDTEGGAEADEFVMRDTGKKDYLRFVEGDERLRSIYPFADKTVLEIGSGIGRMTEFFSSSFKEVKALDVSEAMIDIARKRLSAFPNITFAASSGNAIPFPGNQFDLVFSYQVFKHAQEAALIADYLIEIKRALKPGGMAKIHMRTGPNVHKWRWFYGVSVTPKEAKALAEQAGLTVVDTKVEDVKNLWVWLRK